MTEREAKAFLNNLKVCIEEHPIVADWLVEIADRKTEPTISKMEQVDEPKTQMKTQNSNLTFEKTERKCIDCNFLTYMFGKTWCNIKCENPHDKVCDRFKPKDEPQTDCAWK